MITKKQLLKDYCDLFESHIGLEEKLNENNKKFETLLDVLNLEMSSKRVVKDIISWTLPCFSTGGLDEKIVTEYTIKSKKTNKKHS